MAPKNKNWSRREFLKAAGAVGAGSIVAPIDCLAGSPDESVAIPSRPFGRTGVKVSILGFGGTLDIQQLMLRQAVKWGLTYWDTANTYMGGQGEKRIGKYFGKYPEDRKKIFLVTKTQDASLDFMTKNLNKSL